MSSYTFIPDDEFKKEMPGSCMSLYHGAAMPQCVRATTCKTSVIGYGLIGIGAFFSGASWAQDSSVLPETAGNSYQSWLVFLWLSSIGLAVICAGVYKKLRQLQQQHTALVQENRLLQELGASWVWRTDADYRLVHLHPPYQADSGVWQQNLSHALLWDKFHCSDLIGLRARLKAQAPLENLEANLHFDENDPHSEFIKGRLRGNALFDDHGRLLGYCGIWHEASAATIETSLSLADQGKLEDRETFTYTVSHDLRAPVRVVEGFARILKEDYTKILDRMANDHLDRILSAAARMNYMIDALLALSQISTQPLAHQPVNLSQLAAFVAEDLRRQYPQREVQLIIEPLMQVHGDPTLLRMVLENLLSNAWKYTGKQPQAQICFERCKDKRNTFLVRDNGAGFDMRFADRLFGVFQRLHSANDFQGTGVGLASVKRIVNRHGGEIWAEGEVDNGSNFFFTLP
jgi:signal transduction histidine kinase